MKNKGYWLVFATAIISGLSIFVNKFGVSVVNPYVFTFLKNATVAALLCSVLLASRDRKIIRLLDKKQWLILLLIGLVGGSIPFLLFFKGLSMTGPAGASFIQKTMFVWILIFAGTFLKEKITRKQIFAGLVLIGGNLMLLKISDIRFDTGSGLILLATIFWAVENILSKYALKELPSKIIMWSRMFFGSIFILVFLAFSHQLSFFAGLNIQQIGWTAITSVLLFGYVYTWYAGLKHIKVSEAAIILMLGSPITTALSTFVKPATPKEYLAMSLIVIGVFIAIGFGKAGGKIKQTYVRI